jgi:hypothetical protein
MGASLCRPFQSCRAVGRLANLQLTHSGEAESGEQTDRTDQPDQTYRSAGLETALLANAEADFHSSE